MNVKLGSHSSRFVLVSFAISAFVGCLLIAVVLHEPVPRGHDEFSYVLMGDTFAHGRLANATPPLPEFFDTFHVLVRPVYASKYFPVQRVFLAAGEKLTGHPAVGVWLSSALACAAMYWMLLAWIGPKWAMLGGFLMAVQYGIFSYWSQAYWGGMVAALGGALALGAIRRLWDEFSWRSSFWLALGSVILINSRPLEGALALLPVSAVFMVRLWRQRRWRQTEFRTQVVLPAFIVLGIGAFFTCAYNRAVTGSPWKAPYMLHEEQYQESPEFGFLPLRPKLTYSSPWVRYWYEVRELRTYRALRNPEQLPGGIARKMATWWAFYCGLALTPALVMPGLLRRGRIGLLQAVLVVLLAVLWVFSDPKSIVPRSTIDLLAFAQIVLLWFAFDGFWPRLAMVTSALLIVESFFVKLFFPHYFAPAACLVLYLQVEGLRRIWQWRSQTDATGHNLDRTERRRLARQNRPSQARRPWLRGLVYFVPLACAVSLVLRVEGRVNGWKEDPHGPVRGALLMDDWSLRRADLERWLESQPGPQLVFVWYSARHRVTEEWVYNHADLVHSQVIWARNLGAEHNRLLLQQFPDRTVWLVDADQGEPQLIPYSQVDSQAPLPEPQTSYAGVEQDQLDW